ncbi:hypothetical protein CFK37_14770 [Virgibacillus phasianinus]|uniref:Uncharacterized protein n=2 Tax=Virgibacillus phasianinus TaxID=2017483 RepID=A0A220U592_9BACI|nr:hypothetical protein CFK37_14770 [Virgibacillus phasianinus]
MNGLLFFWFSWLIWVYITFIMKKGKERTFFAIWTLLLISGSSFHFVMFGYKLSLGYLFLVIGAMVMVASTKRLFYHLFSSLTLMVLYMTIKVWENFFPIWMILSKSFVIPFMMVFIILLLVKGFRNRVSIGLLGICSGELVYSFILSSYSLPEPVGGYEFFDYVVVILFLFIGIEAAHAFRVKIRALLYTYKKSFQVLTEE